MAFDDRKTEPLIMVGCLSVIYGLTAAVVGRLFGVWWVFLAAAPPVLAWSALEWLWRCEDNASRSAGSKKADIEDT